jgi:pimeloyl-ACP methyl ester carboxylesterase
MCYKNELLKTPRVLRGFDVKGRDIVVSRENGEKELWMVSQGGAKKLCKGFSPLFVGDHIVYLDAEDGDRTDIFLYQEGSSSHLTREGRNLAPQLSPDKGSIAFLSDVDGPLSLYLLDLRERKRTHILTPESPLSMRPFVWSPDGEYIVYWTRTPPALDSQIWCLHRGTRKTRQIIYFPGSSTRVGNPYIWYLSHVHAPCLKSTVWVDQERFIFLSNVRGYDSLGISTLEGEIQWINDKSRNDKEFYQVSPDGKWVAYNEYMDGTTCLVFLSLEEGTRRKVNTSGCLSHPQWSKKGVYCWESSPTEGSGILYIPLRGEPMCCYREPLPCDTFQPVPIHFHTFDGRTIGAWLYNTNATKVLVWLHGGPADVSLNNFDPVIQYFALSGYAVFTPNFRGSVGYGKELEKLNRNDLGGGDLKDVVEGIHCLERLGYGPFVVGGQSYGAYLASMVLVKYPDVCRGGVCISGIYTLLPEYASNWLINSGCIWMNLEDRHLLADRSFASHIENLAAPVFVIHGTRDGFTPLCGLQYALQKAKEVNKDHLFTIKIYNDEGHGLTKKEHVEETYAMIVEFIDKVMK